MADAKSDNKGKKESDKGPMLHDVHPFSRRAHQSARKVEKKAKKAAQKHLAGASKQPLMDITGWFKEHLDPEKRVYTEAETVAMIERFLDDMEAVYSAATATKSGAATTRGELAKMHVARAREKWAKEGMRAPMITHSGMVRNLADWDGSFIHVDADPIHDKRAIVFKLYRPRDPNEAQVRANGLI